VIRRCLVHGALPVCACLDCAFLASVRLVGLGGAGGSCLCCHPVAFGVC